MKRLLFAFLLSLAAGTTALAQVSVKDPWVRATVPAQSATGAFMQLSAPNGARLVAASSPVAGVVELHEMTMADNVMKMRAIPGLDLPAGKAVELNPGGFHVMLLQLKAQIKEGDTVPLTLFVENKNGSRETLEVKAVARALSDANSMMQHKH